MGRRPKGLKISIDSQQSYDNDIRIGEIVIGPVVVPGRQYPRGRTISMESGTETVETQDGIRYSRKSNPPLECFG